MGHRDTRDGIAQYGNDKNLEKPMAANDRKASLSKAEKVIRKPLNREYVFKAKVTSETRSHNSDMYSFHVSDVARCPELLPYDFELRATGQEYVEAIKLSSGLLGRGVSVAPIVLVLARHLIVTDKSSICSKSKSHILKLLQKDLSVERFDLDRETIVKAVLEGWLTETPRLPTQECLIEAAEASIRRRFDSIDTLKLSRLRPSKT
jgi:hypothetical protein